MQTSEPAVSNADGLRRLLGNSLGFMGRRWAAAQTCLGFHPKPRKGHRPLTLFRWRDYLGLVEFAFFLRGCPGSTDSSQLPQSINARAMRNSDPGFSLNIRKDMPTPMKGATA